MLDNIDCSNAPTEELDDIKKNILNAKFNLYYYVYYINSAYLDTDYKAIYGINNVTYKDINNQTITIQMGDSFFLRPVENEWTNNETIVTDNNKQFIDLDNLVNIGRISPVDGLSNHHIILNIFFTVTLVLNGFKIADEVEPEPDEPTYTFAWWLNNDE